MNIFLMLFQCGAFLIIPGATFAFGIWKLFQVDEKYHRIGIAGLIGFVFFETAVVGSLIDPRSANHSFKETILTAGLIGVITFIFVLLFLPVAIAIYRTFRS